MIKEILNRRLVRLTILLLGGYFLLQMSKNILTLWSSRNRITQAQNRLNQLQEQNSQLQKEAAQAGNPAFIEREARNKLGMVKEGEEVLALPQDQITALAQELRSQYESSQQSPSQSLPNWQQWAKLFSD